LTGIGVAGSDGDLVARARAGDDGAFDALFRKHYAKVVNFALRLQGDTDDAEDIAQTAFVRAHAHVGRIRDGQALLAWLYRTVVNIVRDRAKSASRKPLWRFADLGSTRTAGGSAPVEEVADDSLDPSRRLMAAERDRALERAIAELPLEFREPLVLHHLQQMDVDEVARVLRVPVGTVKSRLSRGRSRLREALAGWFDG